MSEEGKTAPFFTNAPAPFRDATFVRIHGTWGRCKCLLEKETRGLGYNRRGESIRDPTYIKNEQYRTQGAGACFMVVMRIFCCVGMFQRKTCTEDDQSSSRTHAKSKDGNVKPTESCFGGTDFLFGLFSNHIHHTREEHGNVTAVDTTRTHRGAKRV